ncbi:MAG: ABC transporter permease [Pseudomonadales bacterium]|nr:ABC transporter permease [Pseudomonadales bacterium]
MFAYNLRLSWLSLKKTPVLSALMIAAIGIGIGVCMTVFIVYALMTGDPIPARSGHLYTYVLDNHLDEDRGPNDQADPFVGYRDVINLMGSDIPVDESVHYQSSAVFHPDNAQIKPFREVLRLANNGFFRLFEVPFLYGSAWSDEADTKAQFVIVLSRALNDKLFGGVNSVGRKVDVDGHYFEVTGVTDDFSPIPRFFETDGDVFDETDGAYVPFSLTPQLKLAKSNGSVNCIADSKGDSWEDFLDQECTWIHHWVWLKDKADRDRYLQMLKNYTVDQQQYGRYQGEYEVEIFNVMEFLKYRELVNPAYVMLIGIAFMFLVVCLLNTNGLLFAKFSGRAGEISVRRALGCSKKRMFRQHLVEIAVIGVAGGVLGLILASGGLLALKHMFPNYDNVAHLNVELVSIAILMSVVSTMITGLYPAWRICQLPPARYLKAQ